MTAMHPVLLGWLRDRAELADRQLVGTIDDATWTSIRRRSVDWQLNALTRGDTTAERINDYRRMSQRSHARRHLN